MQNTHLSPGPSSGTTTLSSLEHIPSPLWASVSPSVSVCGDSVDDV